MRVSRRRTPRSTALPTVAGAEFVLPAPLTHLDDGVFVVRYWSMDEAGNIEAAKSATVKIDTVRPR